MEEATGLFAQPPAVPGEGREERVESFAGFLTRGRLAPIGLENRASTSRGNRWGNLLHAQMWARADPASDEEIDSPTLSEDR